MVSSIASRRCARRFRRIENTSGRRFRSSTFTRFIFDLPELTPVTVARGKDKLTLTFAKPLRFDLADAKLAMPESVSSIEAARDEDTAEVRFAFARHADVRTFREDSNYVVDVSPIETETPAVEGPPAVTAPQTVPSKAAPEAEEPAKPHAETFGVYRTVCRLCPKVGYIPAAFALQSRTARMNVVSHFAGMLPYVPAEPVVVTVKLMAPPVESAQNGLT